MTFGRSSELHVKYMHFPQATSPLTPEFGYGNFQHDSVLRPAVQPEKRLKDFPRTNAGCRLYKNAAQGIHPSRQLGYPIVLT